MPEDISDKANQLIKRILRDREGKIRYYGMTRYQKFMKANQYENSEKKNFGEMQFC